METTKAIALKKALALLNAAGAEYHIKTEDGEEFGQSLDRPKIRRLRSPARDYYPEIEKLEVGDTFRVPVPNPEDIKRVQGAICGFAFKTFGAGNYITSKSGDGVEILRVS